MSDNRKLLLRIPGDVAKRLDFFRESHEDSVSQNKAIIMLIKRGMSVSPEMKRTRRFCSKCKSEMESKETK